MKALVAVSVACVACVAWVACGKSAVPPPDVVASVDAGRSLDAAPSTDGEVRADAAPPREALPVCGSADWEAMGRARAKACAGKLSDFETTACRVVTKGWRCPADIRGESGSRYGANAVIVMQPNGGEWYGVVFAKRDGAWQVVGITGGDIY